jgi:hypothetical protein
VGFFSNTNFYSNPLLVAPVYYSLPQYHISSGASLYLSFVQTMMQPPAETGQVLRGCLFSVPDNPNRRQTIISAKCELNLKQYLIKSARGETGNGANLGLFGGAFMASRSARTKRSRLSFPAPFSLVHFFWTNKRNEQK